MYSANCVAHSNMERTLTQRQEKIQASFPFDDFQDSVALPSIASNERHKAKYNDDFNMDADRVSALPISLVKRD